MSEQVMTNEQLAATDRRNEKVGHVVSTKMQKTIVVEVEMRKAHPKYKRTVRLTKKFYAHDEKNTAHVGDFVETVEFDHVGVFTYSHEEGTAAHALGDDVPARTKAARQRKLMALQQKIVARRHRRRLGERVTVLIDGPSPEHELAWTGRLPGQAPDIDPIVYLTDGDPEVLRPGDLVEAEIVDSRGYDLVVRV